MSTSPARITPSLLHLPGLYLAVAIALVLTGCASRLPAPVEHRTRPAAEVTTAGQRPGIQAQTEAPVAPKPPPVTRPLPTKAPEPAVAQSAPVRASGIEVRPLNAPTTAAPAAASTQAEVRREPKGTKRPFSDAALAQLKATDPASRTDSRSEGPVRSEPARTDAPPVPPPAPAVVKPTPAAQTGPAAPAPTPAQVASAPPAVSAAEGGAEFAWPTKGKVTQSFGEAKSTGISIAAAAGEAVQAAADGKVIFSGQGPRGYGNLIIVKHDADTLSVYGHNRALLVKEGQTVRKGQRIGEAGEHGADHPKFLFEIRKAGKPVDPLKFLPSR